MTRSEPEAITLQQRESETPQPAHQASRATVFVLFATITVYQLGTGLLTALVPMRFAAEGYAASINGVISTAFSIGFLAGCFVASRIIGGVGPARAIIALAAASAVLTLLLWQIPHPIAWGLLRWLAGLITATYFVLFESWLAELSTSANRGRLFGVYMVINRVTFVLGQIALSLFDQSFGALLLAAALFYALSPLPAVAARAEPPTIARRGGGSLLELPRLAPAAAAASLVHGLVWTAGPTLLPNWGIERGLGVEATAVALAAMQSGGLFVQLPLAALSDRLDRRTVMVLMNLIVLAASIVLLLLPTTAALPRLVVLCIWGGFASSLYSLAAAHANDVAPPAQRVAWMSSLLVLWGIGSALGPLVAALFMDLFGGGALFGFSAVTSAALVLFILRRKRRRGPPAERRPQGGMVGQTPGAEADGR